MRREKISKTKDVLDVEHQVMIGWVWMISYDCSEKNINTSITLKMKGRTHSGNHIITG